MTRTQNFLARAGLSDAETDRRVRAAFDTVFFDPSERFWHEKDPDAGFLEDTGNLDARTEGMSYGMMMCVQMDRRDLFDRLLRFSLR